MIRRGPLAGALALAAVLSALSCGNGEESKAVVEATAETGVPPPVVTLGDIEPFEPAWRIERIFPLAQLLAERLEATTGDARGRVVVAQDIEEMSLLMKSGEVDLFLDSPHPVLAIRRLVGGEIILQREVRGSTEYTSVFVIRDDAEPMQLREFEGRVLALQERHSTSGFLLPALALVTEGLKIREVAPGRREVGVGEVGYFFTRDEENTVEAVVSGAAFAGALSSQDLESVPDELRNRLQVVHRTPPVPRQLVIARAGLDAQRIAEIRNVLLGLDEDDRQALAAQVEGGGWIWRFAELSATDLDSLDGIERRWLQLGQEVGSE